MSFDFLSLPEHIKLYYNANHEKAIKALIYAYEAEFAHAGEIDVKIQKHISKQISYQHIDINKTVDVNQTIDVNQETNIDINKIEIQENTHKLQMELQKVRDDNNKIMFEFSRIQDENYRIKSEYEFNQNEIDKIKLESDIAKIELATIRKEYLSKQTIASTNLGRAGELEFKSICDTLLPKQYIVTDTSKIPHSGDFCITLGKIKCLVDTKNYVSTVNSTQVNKFISDISDTGSQLGLFISFKSDIGGKNKNITLEGTNMYLSNVSEYSSEMIIFSIEFLFSLASNECVGLLPLIDRINSSLANLVVAKKEISHIEKSAIRCKSLLDVMNYNILETIHLMRTKLKS